jgi:hypothetical protein
MDTKQQNLEAHDGRPYMTDQQRTYAGYGASHNRPAPKYVRDLQAWERSAEKVVNQSGLDYEDWTGKQFAAATIIYKNTVAKYGVAQPGPDVPFEESVEGTVPSASGAKLAHRRRGLKAHLIS